MPRPNPGEDKQAYVARFMSSAEARADYPDEKQRAAVAYSMFGERKNSTQLCPSCGAEMTMSPDALVTDCGACGHRLMGQQTPPVEGIDNICRQCRHPLAPEHDDLGCQIPDCPCAVSGAGAIDDIRRLAENVAAERRNAGNCEACQKAAGRPLDQVESSDIFTKDHRFHLTAKKTLNPAGATLYIGACGAQLEVQAENANAGEWVLDSVYAVADQSYEAHDVKKQYESRGSKCKLVTKGNVIELWVQRKERANVRPDFEKTIAAFEAHCKTCPTCGPVRHAPAGSDQADAKNLCPTGAQLLVADLENGEPPTEPVSVGFGWDGGVAPGKETPGKKIPPKPKENAGESRAEDEFKKGDRVKTIEGHPGVVTYAYGAEVMVQLDADSPGPTRYHPTKVFKNSLGDYIAPCPGCGRDNVPVVVDENGKAAYCCASGCGASFEKQWAAKENAIGPSCPCGYEFSAAVREERCPHCGTPNPRPKPIDDVVHNAIFERPCQTCDASGYVEDANGNDVKCAKCKGSGVETASSMKDMKNAAPMTAFSREAIGAARFGSGA
ncbi:MAG: hypothetical protein V4510_10125 [bacterium]